MHGVQWIHPSVCPCLVQVVLHWFNYLQKYISLIVIILTWYSDRSGSCFIVPNLCCGLSAVSPHWPSSREAVTGNSILDFAFSNTLNLFRKFYSIYLSKSWQWTGSARFYFTHEARNLETSSSQRYFKEQGDTSHKATPLAFKRKPTYNFPCNIYGASQLYIFCLIIVSVAMVPYWNKFYVSVLIWHTELSYWFVNPILAVSMGTSQLYISFV